MKLLNQHAHYIAGHEQGVALGVYTIVRDATAKQPNVNIKIGTLGKLSVEYDGLVFRISAVDGEVRINNHPAAVGNVLHDACLLSFGDRSLGSSRQWVTFSSSHPEVVL